MHFNHQDPLPAAIALVEGGSVSKTTYFLYGLRPLWLDRTLERSRQDAWLCNLHRVCMLYHRCRLEVSCLISALGISTLREKRAVLEVELEQQTVWRSFPGRERLFCHVYLIKNSQREEKEGEREKEGWYCLLTLPSFREKRAINTAKVAKWKRYTHET